MIHSGKQLDYAYRHEPDANIRERILLLRRVRIDNQEAASVAELELHRSRGWAYKWLKRYNNEGMLGLKDKPRSGRPADVPVEKLLEGTKELSDNPSGWKVKQIMNIVYERTGVRFVDAFESTLIKNDIDWQGELEKWIVATKKNESIFLEIDLGGWNEAGERRHEIISN